MRLLESTPPLSVEDGMGAGAGDTGCMASSTTPPVNKIRHPFPGRERKHLDDSAGSGRHSSSIFVTHKCRQAAFPHANVTVDDTSEHEHAGTDYTVVRDEEPAKLLGDLVEQCLDVRNC